MENGGEGDGEIAMVVAPDAQYLRVLRLAAADAGGRAGLDASEVDDLRIAVDELCQTLMGVTAHQLVVRIATRDSSVVVRAWARRDAEDPAPRLSTMSELIVDAVSDRYELTHSESEMTFVLAKTAARLRTR